MKVVPLNHGFVAWVDDEDAEAVSRYTWYAKREHRWFYAVHCAGHTTIPMHRLITGAQPGQVVDHVSHRLQIEGVIDNRRENLRVVSALGNVTNSYKQARPTSSAFKGVSWNRRERLWRAYIGSGANRQHLGAFQAEGHAALAYDLAAVTRYGAQAKTNFPIPGSASCLAEARQ